MTKNETTPEGVVERTAIRVQQPLGDFYAFSLRADYLNRISYSYPAEAVERMEQEGSEARGGYSILGSQRAEKRSRLDEIASFIRTTDATFPNAIILGVNYDRDGRYVDDEAQRWTVSGEGERWTLRIPSLSVQSASIIDGQHRLHAFDRLAAEAPERSMELLCVAVLELPTPYHAYVFATINFNQKKVSLDELSALLKKTANLYPGQAVVLRADQKTFHQHVVRVLDVCAKAKIWNISFATTK